MSRQQHQAGWAIWLYHSTCGQFWCSGITSQGLKIHCHREESHREEKITLLQPTHLRPYPTPRKYAVFHCSRHRARVRLFYVVANPTTPDSSKALHDLRIHKQANSEHFTHRAIKLLHGKLCSFKFLKLYDRTTTGSATKFLRRSIATSQKFSVGLH